MYYGNWLRYAIILEKNKCLSFSMLGFEIDVCVGPAALARVA